MSNRLPILSASIRDLHREVVAHENSAAEKMLAMGAALVEAKALCPHGTWTAFLEGAGIADRTAQRHMLLHRAGVKPAMVADLGVAQVEKWAALGLRLWPDGAKGREVVADDGHGAKLYTTILPSPEGGAVYVAAYLFPEPTRDFWVRKKCSLPVVLGVLHEHVTGAYGPYRERDMTAEETRRALAEWQAAA